MIRRASLGEIRTAVASADAYRGYAGVSIEEAVEVMCDYMRLPDDRDRRIVRNALIRRQADGLARSA